MKKITLLNHILKKIIIYKQNIMNVFSKKKKKLFLKKINIFSFHEFLTVNTIFFIDISGIYFQN